MADIMFAQTRWNYHSYTDYWELVRLSGFPIVWLDEMDLYRHEVLYIVSPMNGEFEPFMEQHKDRFSKVMLWNLERPSGSGGLQQYIDDNRKYIDKGYLDGIIVSDRALANDTGFTFVPLGSHIGLGRPGSARDRLLGYSLIHLSCYSNHRAWMFRTPSDPYIELEGLPVARNSWGIARHRALMQTQYMLNVHQDDYLYMEPLRFSLAAAYGLPILSEQCFDVYPYQEGWVSMSPNVRDLLRTEWIGDSKEFMDMYYQLGLNMRKTMTTIYSFKNSLEVFL